MLVSCNQSLSCVFVAYWWPEEDKAVFPVCHYFITCRSSEGYTVEVPYRGDVEVTIQDILGGLRSACTYTGAGKLEELPRRATFIRCT